MYQENPSSYVRRNGNGFSEADIDYFNICRTFVLGKEKNSHKIGTLGEKSLHSIIKHYLSVGTDNQEIKIGAFYADIVRDGHIFEIQTGNFHKLRKKLAYFLPNYPVTVVYPVPHFTYRRWKSLETGVVTPSRKSNRTGNLFDVFHELSRIRPFLLHPNFSLKIIQMDIEEYRIFDANRKTKKKAGQTYDRIPIVLHAEYNFNQPTDYNLFIPDSLPKPFTSEEFRIAASIPTELSNITLLLLFEFGVIHRIGKKGRNYLYQILDNSANL
jgi:hypothetical protein